MFLGVNSRARQALLVTVAAAALVGALLAPSACTRSSNGREAGGRLRVVATVGMLADAARIIGGDRVEVECLMGPGVDPHLYRATERDLGRLTEAHVILYVGLHLEGKMGELFERMRARKRTVACAEGIDRARLRFPDGGESYPDPHIWFDVALWREAVARVEEALAAEDPAGAATYRANAERYQQDLAALDAHVRAEVGRIPVERRVLITSHDAFGYFGRAYGVEVVGLQGISTVSEAGLDDMRRLIDVLVSRRIPAVFAETSVNDRSLRAVIEGARERGHEVRIGGTLYSDSMGAEGTAEGTYVGMVRANVAALVGALGG